MKKFFLMVTGVVFFVGMVSAQDNTQMWVGGSIAIGSTTNTSGNNDVTNSTFSFIPEFGFNLTSEWAVGGRLGISSVGAKSQGVKVSTSTTTFAPFARYTFSRMGDFAFFGQGEVPLSFSDGNNTVGLRVLPGVTYSMGNWGLQAYLPTMLSFESGDGYTNFGLSVNTDLLSGSSLGLIYKF